MKRALVFLLAGPLLAVTSVSLAMALTSKISWWLYLAVMLSVHTMTYIVIMSLLAWLSDVVLVRWEVPRRTRMVVLGGAVTLLTIGLQRYSGMMMVAGLACGSATAFCVWLSDKWLTQRIHGCATGFGKKKPHRVVLVLVALLFAAFTVVEYLNFSGFCYSKRRYLSSHELMAIAIRDNLKRHSPEPNSSRRKIYGSLEDFHRQNPNCCEISRWVTGPFGSPLWLRSFGFYEVLVDIVYRTNDGAAVDNFYGSMSLINSCGDVLEVRGAPMPKNIRSAI